MKCAEVKLAERNDGHLRMYGDAIQLVLFSRIAIQVCAESELEHLLNANAPVRPFTPGCSELSGERQDMALVIPPSRYQLFLYNYVLHLTMY